MQQSLLVAVSAVALIWTGAAQAQAVAPTPITVGAKAEGVLDDSDSRRAQGSDTYVYDDYVISLRQGQRIQIDLTAPSFDPYLELYLQEASLGEPVAENDDNVEGDGMDSRLRYTAVEPGTYIIRARTFMGTDGGSYRLGVEARNPVAYPRGERLSVGNTKTGRLTGSDARDEDENRFDAFVWRAQAGDRVAVSLESDDFDPRLSLGQIRAGSYFELASNDDGIDRQLNAYLVFTAPGAGDYVIKAMAVGNEAEGAYSLGLEEGPMAPRRQPLSLGETVSGTLSADSGIGNNGAHADQYSLYASAGQRLGITLSSEDFDTFVELFDGAMKSVGTDDDSAGELNSRLVFVVPQDGDYVVEARSVGSSRGAYDLKVEILPPPPVPSPIQFGQTLQGELTGAGGSNDEGRPFANYVFTGTKDQRVQLTVRSGDFDAMTQVGMAQDEFSALETDDDGLRQGSDSRLHFTLPEDGNYEVRALAYERDSRGLYSLELMDRGPEPEPGSLLVPATARGALTEKDSVSDDGIVYDAYSFKAKADEKLRFTLISPNFDAVVEVGEEKNGSWRALASDDDSLSDTHARLDWAAPSDGTYQVRVRSFAPGAEGDYVLNVERQP